MEREKRVGNGQLDCRDDRLSELPVFILHNVLSFLDTREACRTSTSSKRWLGIWASNPVLDFRPEHFKKQTLDSGIANKRSREYYDEEFIQSYVGFIENTMQRYSMEEHAISKLKLEIPMADDKLVPMIDVWLEIAAQRKVEELGISVLIQQSPDYKLPKVLFSAKTLKALRCSKVEMPYYQTMRLTSLQCLEIDCGVIDEHMLQCMISSCPLTDLYLASSDLTNISVPWLNGTSEFVAGGPTMDETSSLKTFHYHGDCGRWPFNMNMDALRNLRTVKITYSDITDGTLENMVSKLAMLETLVLGFCNMLKCINISSSQFKNLDLIMCQGLEGVTLDAPHLVSFFYSGIPDISLSVTTCPEECDTHFHINVIPEVVSSSWFIKLKKFLKETNVFKVLEVSKFGTLQVEFDEDEMSTIDVGCPYNLKELKLPFLFDGNRCANSTLMAFVDGLLWCCRPEVLSVTTCLTAQSKIGESLLNPLQEKAKSWRHPLKRIEVEPANCSCLLTDSMLELRFRLHW